MAKESLIEMIFYRNVFVKETIGMIVVRINNMQKFKDGDIILPRRTGKNRLIMGTELQPDGKIYYNYYNGGLVASAIGGPYQRTQPIEIKTMGRCLESTMTNWGTLSTNTEQR